MYFQKLIFSFVLASSLILSLQAREWEHLENCELVPSFLNDGDSFLIRHGDKESVFRLYFVDSPETSEFFGERVAEQAAYYGITKKRTIAVGNYATKFSAHFMEGSFSVYTKWEDAWGQVKRYAAIIAKEDKSLAMELAENGLVRRKGFQPEGEWKGQSAKAIEAKLRNAENRAREKKLGGWAPAGQSFPPLGSLSTVLPEAKEIPDQDRLNLNLSSSAELETLPSIGKTLAGRIIEGRPWHRVDDIRKVKGIGDKAMLQLKPLVTVVHPNAPLGTADYFRKNRDRWMGRLIHVSIESVVYQNWPAPDGFVVVLALTAKDGVPGGAIPIFFPEDRLEQVLLFYGEDSAKGETTVLFYHYNGEDVLVKR